MPNANDRFFVIRPDGNTSTVTNEQLNTMRLNGFVGPEDKIVPIPNQPTFAPPAASPALNDPEPIAAPNKVEAGPDDLDTAPLSAENIPVRRNPNESDFKNFDNLDDLEIEQAFSNATSQSLYHMDVDDSNSSAALPQSNLTSSSSSQIVEDQPLYNVLFTDGRVLGPFNNANIWERFSQNMLSGTEQIALAGSEAYKPILSNVEFRCAYKAFHENTLAQTNVYRINEASIAPYLLRLAHDLVTGWLVVKQEEQTLIVSWTLGKITHIRGNEVIQDTNEELITRLFSFNSGSAWFEADSLAASDSRSILINVLSLCRQHTGIHNQAFLSQIIKYVGDQNRALQITRKDRWSLAEEELSELELGFLNFAKQGKTVRETLQELLKLNASKEESLHALYMTLIGNCVSIVEEHVTNEIKDFTSKLLSNRFIELFNLNSKSSEKNVSRELTALKDRIAKIAQLLPENNPLVEDMQERFNYIKKLFANRTERFVILKAYEQNQDLEKNPKLAFSLKKEFLESAVKLAIEQKKYLEILPEAELYRELCPNSSEALSYLLLARFFSASNPFEQKPTLNMLKSAQKLFPKSPDILRAAATLYIQSHSFSQARSCLKTLQKIEPYDPALTSLRLELKSQLGTPFADSVTIALPWLNIVFACFITLAMFGLLWLLGVDIGLGKTETVTQKTDSYIWIRAGVLTFFTAIGFGIIHRQGFGVFFSRLNYKTSWVWLVLAVVIAIVCAAGFDVHGLADMELGWFAIVSLFAAVFFDRLYFSGFLGQDFTQGIKNKWVGMALLTILYTLYHFTYYELMYLPFEEVFTTLVILFCIISFPLAFLQYLSKSVTPPFLFLLIFIFAEYIFTFKIYLGK